MEYLLKASAIIALFYICYKLLLQRETFFNANRSFLFAGLLIAFCIPFVVIPIYISQAPQHFDFIVANTTITENISVAPTVDWFQIMNLIYVIGVLFFVIRFTIQLLSLSVLLLKSEKQKIENYIFVKVDDDVSPFSFFNYIIYNPKQFDDKDLHQVITHEKAHAKQYHSLDILLSHLVSIVLWFNPFVWLYKKEVQQNLEFIADQEAQKELECTKSYQFLLLKSSVSNYQMALANNFYNSLIKKRIVMLHKNRSKNRNQWKIAIVTPLIALFLMSFNTKEINTYDAALNSDETAETLNEPGDTEIIAITKDTSDDELKKITETLKEKGITLKFKGVKRNKNNEITDISITAKTEKSNATYSESDDGPIQPIKITIKENGSISIGNGHDTGHRDYVYETKGKDGKVHKTKSGNVFVYSSSEHDDEHEDHDEHEDDDEHEHIEVIEDGGKMIIKRNGKVHEVKKGEKGKSVFVIGDSKDGKLIELKGDGDGHKVIFKKGKTVVVKKDKKGNVLKETVISGDDDNSQNIWITHDEDDEDTIFDLSKDNNNLFISSDKKALWIIDGKEVIGAKLDLDPNNIKSVTVLKGESATKKYGKKGKDGVIEVITKDN